MHRIRLLLSVAVMLLLNRAVPLGRRAHAQDATPGAMATPAAPGQPVEINGVEIYYELRGDPAGPPLLLLHGGMGSGEDWGKQVPALVDAGYRVILMDSRSHGRSPCLGEAITYELMASDVVGLLDHLGIEKTDLVGASDGAIIGLYLAIHHPDRLTKVVAYGANYNPEGSLDPTPSPELDAIFSYLAENYQRLSPTPEHFDDLLGELLALYEVAPNFSEDELRSITAPVLILDGADEELVAHDQPGRMAELIPGSELVIMPGTGHLAPFEQPEEFNHIVLDYLSS